MSSGHGSLFHPPRLLRPSRPPPPSRRPRLPASSVPSGALMRHSEKCFPAPSPLQEKDSAPDAAETASLRAPPFRCLQPYQGRRAGSGKQERASRRSGHGTALRPPPPSLPLQGMAGVLTWRKLFTKSFICFTGGGFRPFFTSHREAAGKATIGGKASFPSVVLPSALP